MRANLNIGDTNINIIPTTNGTAHLVTVQEQNPDGKIEHEASAEVPDEQHAGALIRDFLNPDEPQDTGPYSFATLFPESMP
jgi:hypothetical protein